MADSALMAFGMPSAIQHEFYAASEEILSEVLYCPVDDFWTTTNDPDIQSQKILGTDLSTVPSSPAHFDAFHSNVVPNFLHPNDRHPSELQNVIQSSANPIPIMSYYVR